MAKMYTLDDKLLIGSPEIRIGDEIFMVDDRKKNVEKLLKLYDGNDNDDNTTNITKLDECMKIALGTAGFKKLEALNLSWAAYQEVFSLIMSAVTGEDPEKVKVRFSESEET